MINYNLDDIAKNYDGLHEEWSGLLKLVRENECSILMKHAKRAKSVMEIGLGNGVFTKFLSHHFDEVIAVDGSAETIKCVQKGLSECTNIRYLEAFVENLTIPMSIDFIVMSHLLEHLKDPVGALTHIMEQVSPTCMLYLSVPNAFSLHRQVAVKMGLLSSCDSLNDTDVKLGHYRVYTPQLFRDHFKQAGFEIVEYGGSMLKPLTNKQIQDTWDEKMMMGFIELGKDYPDLCGDIYVIARKIGHDLGS